VRTSAKRTLVALLLAGLAASCDTGPDGPGTVEGTVVGPADLAGAVLDVVWRGVQGFEGRGDTQVYWAPVTGEDDRYRVILVRATGGRMGFGIRVDDVYLEGPVVTVVEAVGSDDLPRTSANVTVVLER